MASKLWLSLCLIFFFHNILILKEEFTSIKFVNEEKNRTLYHLFCLPINELIEFKLLEKSKIYSPKQLIDKIRTELFEINYLNIESSFIFHYHVCLEFEVEKFPYLFIIISKFKFKLLLKLSKNYNSYFYENLYTHNPYVNKTFNLMVYASRIKYLEWPYDTNCIKSMKFKLDQKLVYKKYNRIDCILECYKSIEHNLLFKYNYNENVNLSIKTHHDHRFNFNLNCEKLCSHFDCENKYMLTFLKYNKNNNISTIESQNYLIKAIPYTNRFEFWINLLSIVSLFLNLSLHDFLCLSMLLIKKINFVDKFIIKFYFLINISTILLLYSLTIYSIIQYNKFNYVIYEFSKQTKELEPFSFVVCLPLQKCYANNSLHDNLISIDNEKFYENRSIKQIIQDTNLILIKSIKSIYLSKGGTMERFNLKPINEIMFREVKFLADEFSDKRISLLSRCFQFKINIREDKFVRDCAFTQIIIKFYHTNFKVFLLDYDEKFTYSHQSFPLLSKAYSEKARYLQYPFKSNCKKYRDQCRSREHCVDMCYNRNFMTNYLSLSINSVISGNEFNETSINYYFNRNKDQQIREHCESIYKQKDCSILKFVEELEQQEVFEKMRNRIVLELYYFKVHTVEIPDISFLSLIFKILNYLSLIINLNFHSFVSLLIAILRRKLNSKLIKLIEFSLKSICFLLFIAHSFYIFYEIVNGRLLTTLEYHNLDDINMPSFLVCFELDYSNIDPYERIDGHYLDRYSKDLNLESIFDKITIYDNNLNEMNISFKNINEIADKIKMSHPFYIYSLKCFDFITTIDFKQRDQILLDDFFFLKIYFNNQFYFRDKCNCFKLFITFFDKNYGNSEKVQSYYFQRTNNSKISLRIRPIKIQMKYFDSFIYLKNPLTLFKIDSYINEDYKYYSYVYKEFERITNSSTQLIPLKKNKFQLEIEDDLFRQYFNQIQAPNDNGSYINPNFEAVYYAINPINSFEHLDSPELIISYFFLKTNLIITNEYSITKFTCNILNCCSLWLSLNVNSLDNYILFIFILFEKFYKLLLSFECKLYSLIRRNRF